MFWNEKIENLECATSLLKSKINVIENFTHELADSAKEHEERLNEQDKHLNCHADEIEQINNKINAIVECLNGDRKDINILITMVKTLKTAKKGRK